MKNSFIILFVSAILLLLFGTNLNAGNLIKVKGNKFVDSDGKEIVFRGLCFADAHDVDRQGHWDEIL